jgi:cytochrome c-type biogenesis protein CcmE
MTEIPTPDDEKSDAKAAPNKVRKPMSKLPFIVTMLAVGILAMVLLTGVSGGRYSLEIKSVLDNQVEFENKEIKVVGRIKSDWREEAGTTIFVIHDDAGKEITVSYAGNRPDPFKEGRKCIVEGRLRPDGVIECSKLTVKCPSKYQSENDLEGDSEDNSVAYPSE